MKAQEFEFLDKVDSGSFSTIHLCRRISDDGEFIIKKSKYFKYADNEVSIMRKLRHPNVVTFHGTWKDENAVYIVMEFLSGGSLADLLWNYEEEYTPMDEQDALKFFSQLALGLHHIHSLRIMHRDLKPENVMFTAPSRKVKILDFGLSWDTSTEEKVRVLNPNAWSAPEHWSTDAPHSFSSDIWSIGALLFQVITGKEPKKLQDKLELLTRFPLPLQTISEKILKIEPDQRPSTAEVISSPELKSSIVEYYKDLQQCEKTIMKDELENLVLFEES
ncbi:hypothetical protein QAD02_023211 [Eretmocerus hayati]|uniref:Uncharacterized protein n=1 Tax=Eretmocerus hayati TaxID=131215 RepID=A0ACC2PYL5_9HYME|nr:hypothetical protein QAD02_023211 [Eretmocerus hayati]